MDKKKSNKRWFSDTKLLKKLFLVILILTIVFLGWKIRFIFDPIRALFTAVGAPILIAGVFYYLLKPFVSWLDAHTNIPRKISVAIILVILLVIIGGILTIVVSVLRDQVLSIIDHWPSYWHTTQKFINETFASEQFKPVRDFLSNTNSNINNNIVDWGKKYLTEGMAEFSSIASKLTTVGVTAVSTPFILYYMLLDGHKFSGFISDKLPKTLQGSVQSLLKDMSSQISQYIRGQLGVAFSVMVMFSIGYTIIGLPYGILLAIMAGFFNMIPYVGSILSQIPVFIIAVIVGGPKLLILSIIVLAIEQPIEAHVIAPKILGQALSIHPVTVIVVLLSGGHIFGVLGIILAVPTYAVVKVIVSRIYIWWRSNSNYFKEDTDDIVK